MKYVIDIPEDMIIKSALNGLTLGIPMLVSATQKEYVLPTNIQLNQYTEFNRKAIEDVVWEFARKMISTSGNEVSEMWGCATNFGEVMHNTTYSEAKAKYEAWLKQKDEIKVGDEVIPTDTQYDTMIVTRIWMDDHSRDCLDTLGLNGCICSFLTSNVKKTGRHFPEVAKLLEKMRGEE